MSPSTNASFSYRSQIPFNTHDPLWFLIADCCNVRWWVGRRLSREMPLLNLLLKPLFPPVQYWLAPKGSELGDDNVIVYVGLYVVTKLTCYLLGCLLEWWVGHRGKSFSFWFLFLSSFLRQKATSQRLWVKKKEASLVQYFKRRDIKKTMSCVPLRFDFVLKVY